MQTNNNEKKFDKEFERPVVLNDDFYLKEYFLIIKASNLEGAYQSKLGFLIVITYLLSNLFNVMICTQKNQADYFCVFQEAWEDNAIYNDFKSNTKRYKVIHEEECIVSFCFDYVDNDIYLNSNSKLHNQGNVYERLITLNKYIPQLVIVDSEAVFNIYSYFGIFCEEDKKEFLNNMILHIYSGSLIGYFIFPLLSEYLGRQYSFTIMLSLLIVCNIIFIAFPIKQDVFLVVLLVYSTTLYFLTLSDIVSLEAMSGEMQRTVSMKRHMYYYLFALGFTFLYQKYSDFKIISYVNIILSVISVLLAYKSIKETPKYLLDRKYFLRLRKNITKISKINNTYDYHVKEMFRKIDKQKRFSKEMLKVDVDYLIIKREKRKFSIKVFLEYLNLKLVRAFKNFVFFFPVAMMYLSLNFCLTYTMFHLKTFTDCYIFFISGFLVYFYSNLRQQAADFSKIFRIKIYISLLFSIIALICNIYSYLLLLTENEYLFFIKNGIFFVIITLININIQNLDFFVKLSNCFFERNELKSIRYDINDIHVPLYITLSILMIFSRFIFSIQIPQFTIFSYLFYCSALVSLIYLRIN
jgi:hypothetical protein